MIWYYRINQIIRIYIKKTGRSIIIYYKMLVYRNPHALHDIVNGNSFLGNSLQHALNKALGIVWNSWPFVFGEGELTCFDAPFHTRWNWLTMSTVKGWITYYLNRWDFKIWNLLVWLFEYLPQHKIYIITPKDQISQDISYLTDPSTSGAT